MMSPRPPQPAALAVVAAGKAERAHWRHRSLARGARAAQGEVVAWVAPAALAESVTAETATLELTVSEAPTGNKVRWVAPVNAAAPG